MKRALKIGCLATLSLVTVFGATSAALAWFFGGADVKPEAFYGSSQGAYFAYGSGTYRDPYGINKPRHLYNLSWLNMMGYFEGEGRGTNGVVYFEIDPSIENGILDGTNPNTGLPTAIPPIGTEEHPFYGNFNGNGKVIRNFIVSADDSDYGTQKPYNYSDFFSVPNIVGLFGVVGKIDSESDYTYDSSTNEIYNLGITDLTIKTKAAESLVGIVAGYVNGSISNVVVNASAIDVSTDTTSALTDYTPNLSDYGIIGHCTKNYSQMEDQTDPNEYYDNKDAYRTYARIYEVNTVDRPEPFNAHAKGKQVGGGASIEMKTMYNNLCEIWERVTGTPNNYRAKYTTGTVKVIQSSDESEEVIQEGTESNEYTYFNSSETQTNNSWSNGYHSYFNDKQTYNGKTTASYSLVVENAQQSQYSSNYSIEYDKKYMCITGKKEVPVTGRTYTKQTYYNYNKSGYNPNTYTGYRIYWQESANTYHYLTFDGSGYDSTSEESASLWAFDNSNHLLTVDSHHIPYYLECDSSGTLSMSESTPTATWTYDSTNHNYTTTVSGTTYYLGFNGTTWTTTVYNSTAVDYYLIHDGSGHYMSHPDTYGNVDAVTSSVRPNSSETRWYLNSYNYFATTDGGSYYLRRNGNTNNSRRAYYSNSTTNVFSYSGTTNVGDNTGAYLKSGSYYPYYSSSGNYRWRLNATANSLTFTRVVSQAGYQDSIHCGSIYRSSETVTITKYNYQQTTPTCQARTQDTYFPLRRDDDNSSMVDDANTGYVVGGARYTEDKYGDIRVSAFDVSDLDASYTSGASDFTNVYTINGGITGKGTASQQSITVGTGAVSNSSRTFTRFSNVKAQMIDTLKNDNTESKIYGLHFMNASISSSNTIFAPWVKVRNKSEKDLVGNEVAYSIYENYEMPEDSIDFHFGENGIITFIAGSYFKGSGGWNNCFFSLHQIERYTSAQEATDAGKKVNDIKAIKEIHYVYDNTDSSTKADYPYVYEYSNGSYSTGTPGTNALFNTDWIKNTGNLTLTTNAAYYFEIPAIKGEYALGSVYASDGTKRGAYLMYLDLGANGNKIARTTVYDHFTVTKEVYDYPIGVSLASSSVTPVATSYTATPLDSANVVIKEGFVGTLTITRSSNNVAAVSTLPEGFSVANYVQANYLGGGYYPLTISLNDGASPTPNPIEAIPKTIVEEEHERVQFLDYGINYLTLTQTVVDRVTTTTINDYGVTTVTPSTVDTTIKQYAYDANYNLIAAKTFTTPEQESSIIVYNPDSATDPGAPYETATRKDDIMALYTNTNTDFIYQICIPNDATTTIVIDAAIIRSAIDANYHFDVSGYNVTVSVTGTAVTVTVLDRDTSYTFTLNGNPFNSGSTTVSQS